MRSSSFYLSSSLRASAALGSGGLRILLESIPSNGEFLQQFIDAMKSNVRVRIQYKKYGSDEVTTKVVDPYCVKLFKRRWYAQVKNLYRGTLYVLAFDRIISLELTDHHFDIDQDYDAAPYFDDCIGIFKNPEVPLTRIVFRAYGREVFYQRDLPFHHSQKEILTAEDYSDFELWLRPTNELYTPLLSRGCNIQVLEPQWLVEEIKSQIDIMGARYK